MPSNKLGGLKAGQGVRRIQAQRTGGWRDQDAKASYEVGAELHPNESSADAPTRKGRWSGQNR